jgi:hypothetical protein
MAKSRKSLTEAADKELKTAFSLDKFKANKGLASNVKFKEQKWIPFSPALQEALSIPGIPMGHNSMVRGKSNTGKSTMTIEVAVNAQKMGVLPVLIITEMKHDWNHWRTMGFEMEDVVDKETGEIIDQTGFFIYRDRSSLNSIEDIAAFIIDLLTEQKKGNLPYDLLFIWDSVGSIPCQMSIEQGKNNPMWNAGAIATQFGNFINQQIVMSRKESSKYTNTLFIVNKVGVAPALTPMSQPRMTNKGGDTFYYDVSLCLTFGNVTNAGTSKINAVKENPSVGCLTFKPDSSGRKFSKCLNSIIIEYSSCCLGNNSVTGNIIQSVTGNRLAITAGKKNSGFRNPIQVIS